ncbi:MAG: hypothetical protein HRU30_11230 [Rhodobacteraceae bacterium]|nr:hypothetical protein [Paracoccaceae bacterium]
MKADWSHARPFVVLLAIMLVAALWGVIALLLGNTEYSAPMVTFNLFWLAWNAAAVAPALRMATWLPKEHLSNPQGSLQKMHGDTYAEHA